MSPEPTYRLTVAPRFAVTSFWRERLAHNRGVTIEAGSGCAQPREGWAALDDTELASLVDPEAGREVALPPTHLGLMQVPERLRRAWWACAERGGSAADADFEPVFVEMAEFLRFKGLPLPERVHLEVAVSAPGLRSTRVGADGAPLGLGFGDRPATADAPGRVPLGLVNLGDEASFVVLVAHPPQTLAARLVAAGAPDVETLAPQALVACFLSAFPEEPLLRVRLAPGEGLWLSPFGVVHDGWTQDKKDVDVVLSVG